MATERNYRKKTRAYDVAYTNLQGASSAIGHASRLGVGLHIQDRREPDRPAALLIYDVEQAREIVKMMQEFIDAQA